MKNFIAITLLLISSASFAQLKKVKVEKAEEIGKIQPLGLPLEAECTKRGNVYTISFRDAEFKQLVQYREFSFEDVENTFEDLYAVIEDGFENVPEESIMLELPDHYIWVSFEKFLGAPLLRLSMSSDKSGASQIYISNQMNKKQVQKLFGKR